MVIDIYLVRHGETENNKKGILVGRRDVELSVEGRQQIKELVRRHPFPQPSVVYVSPMRRCMETACLVFGRSLEHSGPRIEKSLAEMDFGSYEGLPVRAFAGTELYKGWAEQRPDAGLTGGETFGEVERRMIKAFDRILGNCLQEGIRTAGVVSHNMVIVRLLRGHITEELPAEARFCPNGMGFHLRADSETWKTVRMMELAGLLPEGAIWPDPRQSPYMIKRNEPDTHNEEEEK